MPIEQITPRDAKSRLDAGEGVVYLDVRTEQEFAAGHAPGAVNIPVANVDPARGMMLNQGFLAAVQERYAPEQRFVVGCAAGGRSQRACEMLASSGYTSLANIRGGFMGARDPMGRVIENGWAQEGFPVETGS